jgi:uncharacterized damage-inducible protein DinB
MEAALASAASMFRAADHYMADSVSGLSAEPLTQRIGAANSILWIVGHVTVGRSRLLALLGEPGEVPWAAFFGKGSAEAVDPARPDLETMLTRWRAAATVLEHRLAALTAAELAAVMPYDLPTSDPTLLGVITYFAFHEAYHIGQIASTRKALGRPLPRRTADRASLHRGEPPH